jgi:NADPH:quinone reductase-like Zn-dependent oxidoreductase
MRAIRFENAGNADVIKLVVEPIPQVRPHDLLVRVRAAGLNRADILQRQGCYGNSRTSATPSFPVWKSLARWLRWALQRLVSGTVTA